MGEDFLKLIKPGEAVNIVLEALADYEPPPEVVSLDEAVGRVVAFNVESPEDLPAFARSAMDGYAVRARDTFGATESLPAYLEVSGEALMGEPVDIELEPGKAILLSTGGQIPPGADAVVMVENTELESGLLEIRKAVAPGENIVLPGDDIPKGAVVLEKGELIGPPQAGSLAALGITSIEVFTLPVVGIISTGDELVPPEVSPGPGKVRDVNSTAVRAAVRMQGCKEKSYGIVRDEFETLRLACRRALEECDMLIISGSSSMGVKDMASCVFDSLGSPGVLAHGLHMKPGKPALIAFCDGKPAVGLPGNPASALVVFSEVIRPILAQLRGEKKGLVGFAPRVLEGRITKSVASKTGKEELLPVELSEEGSDILATPVLGKSSLIGTLVRADGFVRISEASEGVEKGSVVKVELGWWS
ncbi:MAG: molybdopterin-binding protein [Actinomycetota bacterium]|nr:molybdopterin-binding protein [Actinomycetota bacterium]